MKKEIQFTNTEKKLMIKCITFQGKKHRFRE